MYFDDRAEENASDPLLSTIDAARRATMIAARSGERGGAAEFRFDIVLQGDRETAFLEL